MKIGEIVLIPFPFTDLSGQKNRPAIILINSDDDVTVCFLTTQLKYLSEFDFIVHPSEENGLLKLSLIRLNKLATIDKELIIGRLGELEIHNIGLLNRNLFRILKLEDTQKGRY